jgi:hypothetical protein
MVSAKTLLSGSGLTVPQAPIALRATQIDPNGKKKRKEKELIRRLVLTRYPSTVLSNTASLNTR